MYAYVQYTLYLLFAGRIDNVSMAKCRPVQELMLLLVVIVVLVFHLAQLLG